MYTLWSLTKLCGLLFDIIGGVLIAVAVVRETGKKTIGKPLEDLEKEIDTNINQETLLSSIGLGFIIAGFILLFIYEAKHNWV